MTGGRSSLDLGNTDAIFLPLLDRELRKICVFYETEEQRLTEDLATLQTDIERQEESGPDAGLRYLDEEGDEDDDEDEDYQLQSPTATLNRDRTQSPARRRKSSRSMSSTGARGAYFTA
uniref:Ku seventy n=1 Tax=Ganoderma boninense TaxID=34458 RepID=A0A5K1JTZ7_9APHY|nr:Ku seventy [Ganoderma boninense]